MNGSVSSSTSEGFRVLVQAKCAARGHLFDEGVCVRCDSPLAAASATRPETPAAKKKARHKVDKALPGARRETVVEVPTEEDEPEPPTEPKPKLEVANGQIVGIDPGFAAIGYCTLGIDMSHALRLEQFGVFTTQKSDKKRRTLAVEDNVRRAIEIATFFCKLVSDDTIAICAEAMSHPRNASAAAKVAMTWGVIATVAHVRSIPIFQASPQEVKIDSCGRKSASKEDIQAAMRERHDSTRTLETKIPKALREHCFDALAAAETCIKGDSLRVALRFA